MADDRLPERDPTAAELTEQLHDAELPTTTRALVEAMEQTVRDLASAVNAVRDYGGRHASATTRLRAAHAALTALLKMRAPCTLQFIEGVPQFDEVPMLDLREQYRDLMARARARKIEGISFQEGVTVDELRALGEVLGRPSKEVADAGGPRPLMQAAGVLRIILGLIERDTASSGPGEEAREQAVAEYQRTLHAFRDVWAQAALGRLPEIGRAQECVRNMVQSVLGNAAALAGLASLKRYDDYSHTHSVHVAVYSVLLGKELMLDEDELVMLGVSGLLHDVGKAEVPLEVVNKPGKLTTAEWRLMQSHTWRGARILQEGGAAMAIPARAAYEHHLHLNMQGYPRLTRPRKLTLYSMAVTIADFYDAVSTVRPYKRAFLPDDCLRLMMANSGIQFEPRLLDYFVRGMGLFPVGSLVQLDTGEYAVVLEINPEDRERPKVKIVIDAEGQHLDQPRDADLTERGGREFARTALRCVDPLTRGVNIRAFVDTR